MNIGEFIIKIGTQGNTKGLDDAIKKMSEAEKKTRKQIKLMRDLNKATSDQEKELIKKNAAQQDELEGLKAVKSQQDELTNSMKISMMTSIKFIGAIGATVTMLDRLGNSLLKSNQMYITFEKQTGLGIGRLNRMAGLAQLSGMGLSPEQVAGDLQGLQQRIFRLGMTGEGSGIFAQLGMNPMGMKSDQFIAALRQRTKGMSAQSKSYILSELGLSQEWLNVLELTNEQFAQHIKDSKELQLSEKERKQLAQYTAQQQKNNMRWELAKQRLLIAAMPLIQKIMDMTSKIALQISNVLEKNPQWLYVVKDILLLLAGNSVIKTISAISKLLSGGIIGGLLGGVAGKSIFGKTAGKGLMRLAGAGGIGAAGGIIAKRGAAALGGLAGGPIGAIFSIAMGIWMIVDLFKLFINKEDEKDEDLPDPAELDTGYQYRNINSNMTNHFYNNPAPQQAVISELENISHRYLETAYL